MIQIKEKNFYTLLNFFFSDFFCDYLEEVIDDRNLEKSVVTLFEGMNFFIEIALEQKIELPFKTIREYIVQNYEGGENIYIDLNDRYQKEIKDYTPKKKRFEDIYGKIEFNW